ncbi:Alpha-1,3-mannosyltransferase-like protein [Microbotryomycetes sp. JL201]|nr:Alpha-1,3-mannosyltransferase-like protein [Microbotryomycetes sp. JL201]
MNLDPVGGRRPAKYAPVELGDSLRIAFIHPDLGIGGAERFVVDAAVALQQLGHDVQLFTSYHEDGADGRSFRETKDDWSWRRQLEPFDVLVVDQLSASIPLLRWFGQNRVVFYCHFPDQLLSPGRPASHSSNDPRQRRPTTLKESIRTFYRAPIDAFEETTTGEADKILVNSEFTSQVFQKTFAGLRRIPRTVYPAVNVDAFSLKRDSAQAVDWLKTNDPVLLSINRFEKKKNVALALDAFADASKHHPSLKLVVAGGFDARLPDNVSTLAALQKLADKLGMSHYTYSSSPSSSSLPKTLSVEPEPPSDLPQILFLLNMDEQQKQHLMTAPTTLALLYTPSFEHFGIVPIEAMASQLPVIATTSGGPTESVLDRGLESDDTTGLLRDPRPQEWSEAIRALLQLSTDRRLRLGRAGRQRVESMFSSKKLGQELERACRDAASIGQPIYTEAGFKKMLVFSISLFACVAAGLLAFVMSWKGGRLDERGRPIVGLHQMMRADRLLKEKAKMRQEVMKEVMKERILRGEEL